MPYITYDEKRAGMIVGRFTKEALARRDSYPELEVDASQFEAISKDPNSYHVVNNKLKAIEKPFTNFNSELNQSAEKKNTSGAITKMLEAGTYEYKPDSMFQQNLTLNLAICALDESHTTSLWCLKDSKWEFKQHDKTELLEIARTLNLRRETKSQELYKNL